MDIDLKNLEISNVSSLPILIQGGTKGYIIITVNYDIRPGSSLKQFLLAHSGNY